MEVSIVISTQKILFVFIILSMVSFMKKLVGVVLRSFRQLAKLLHNGFSITYTEKVIKDRIFFLIYYYEQHI